MIHRGENWTVYICLDWIWSRFTSPGFSIKRFYTSSTVSVGVTFTYTQIVHVNLHSIIEIPRIVYGNTALMMTCRGFIAACIVFHIIRLCKDIGRRTTASCRGHRFDTFSLMFPTRTRLGYIIFIGGILSSIVCISFRFRAQRAMVLRWFCFVFFFFVCLCTLFRVGGTLWS